MEIISTNNLEIHQREDIYSVRPSFDALRLLRMSGNNPKATDKKSKPQKNLYQRTRILRLRSGRADWYKFLRITRNIYLTIFTLINTITTINTSINTKSTTSTINISSNANLSIKNPITNFQGKIIKNSNASISGNSISFCNGRLETEENKITLSGTLTSTNKLILNGNKNLNAKKGIVAQSIEISNKNNIIEGNVLIDNNITLKDQSTTVTLAIHNTLSNNIELNNGTIYLEDDLIFTDEKKLIGPGKIIPQNRKIIFNGRNITWNTPIVFGTNSNIEINTNLNLSETWTFTDSSTHILDGQNNILTLESLGQISIDNCSTLIIKNLIINNISEQNIKCLGNSTKIIFQNVKLILSDDFQFQNGSFEVFDSFELNGPYTFAYQTTQTSTIKQRSNLILDNYITFSYDPGTASKNLIALENETSSLIFNNASLHVTTTGIELIKGNLFINGNVNLASEKQVYEKELDLTKPDLSREDLANRIIEIEYGINFGDNNNQTNDLYCEVSNPAILNIQNGTLNYKNLKQNSWKMLGNKSCLNINSNSNLKLYQTLNLKNGIATFQSHSTLSKAINKSLFGTINSTGKIKKRHF